MTNQPTTRSSELPPGTVIELPDHAGGGEPWRYTLIARVHLPGRPGWHVDDPDDAADSSAFLLDETIDRGYTLVGGSVEATVGLPEPLARLRTWREDVYGDYLAHLGSIPATQADLEAIRDVINGLVDVVNTLLAERATP